MSHERRALAALARNDLNAFIRMTFHHLHPIAEYQNNWHIETMAHHLQLCAEGKIDRLIITLPPRHLKSNCVSVAFPAWLLGQYPSSNVVCASYSSDLAAKHARDCRSVIESLWYKDLFRGTRINPRKNTEMELETTRNGGRFATSVEGTLTGRGGSIIIIDDPIKPDGAMSEADRKRVNEWFRRTVYTRLNDRNEGCIIIVMQRVHEDDLVGHVLDLDDWTVLNIPAKAEQPMEYRVGNGPEDVYPREKGELIDSRWLDAGELARLERMLGTYNFAAQYQQNPIPVEGNLVKCEWFQTYTSLPDREDMDAVVLSWDTAVAAGELNDYSVCTVWGVVGQCYYLIDDVRRKLDYPDLRSLAFRLVRQYDADIVLVERAGTGTSLAQELRKLVGARVLALPARGDKEVRFAAQSAVIEQGRVLLPENAPWLHEFKKELLGFPGTKHDDQVDSVELFLRFANGRLGMRMANRRYGRARPQPVRPQGHRSTGFNARRYLDELLRPPTDAPSLF